MIEFEQEARAPWEYIVRFRYHQFGEAEYLFLTISCQEEKCFQYFEKESIKYLQARNREKYFLCISVESTESILAIVIQMNGCRLSSGTISL